VSDGSALEKVADMQTQITWTRSGGPTKAAPSNPRRSCRSRRRKEIAMPFEVYRNNGGQYHWRLVGDDGVEPAVSRAAFASEQAARESAAAVRAHTGMPEAGR
jgi:uncharacterized protein YegP (UPF0339 family)